MTPEMLNEFFMSMGKLSAALTICLSAIGSSLGTGAAGMAAAGAWKKCYMQSKIAPFMLVAFVGLPLTQTIYGMIVMNAIIRSVEQNDGAAFIPIAGLFAGAAMGLASWLKGKAGAGAADALAETGRGFINYLMILGVIETVSLFVMVFVTKTLV